MSSLICKRYNLCLGNELLCFYYVAFLLEQFASVGYLSQSIIVESISNRYEIIEKTSLSSAIFSHLFGNKIFQNKSQMILCRLFLDLQKMHIPWNLLCPEVCLMQCLKK